MKLTHTSVYVPRGTILNETISHLETCRPANLQTRILAPIPWLLGVLFLQLQPQTGSSIAAPPIRASISRAMPPVSACPAVPLRRRPAVAEQDTRPYSRW